MLGISDAYNSRQDGLVPLPEDYMFPAFEKRLRLVVLSVHPRGNRVVHRLHSGYILVLRWTRYCRAVIVLARTYALGIQLAIAWLGRQDWMDVRLALFFSESYRFP